MARMRGSDLLGRGRRAAWVHRVVLTARHVGRAVDVVHPHAVAALGMAIDLAPEDREYRELGQITCEARPPPVPVAARVVGAGDREEPVPDDHLATFPCG